MDDQQVIGVGSSSSSDVSKIDGKMGYNLLEECWFFDNLLIGKTRYSRSNSDHSDHASSSSSSTSNQQESAPSVSEVYAEIIKQENSTEQETSKSVKISKQKNRPLVRVNQGLNRAPSLPTNYMGMELKESCQERVPHKASKLSRQGSLTPNLLPPKKGHAKGRICRTESLNLEAINEMRSGYVKYQKNSKKTASALEYEEVQGFKDLGFSFDTSELSPKVLSILPGLQEKKRAMSNIDELVEVKNEVRDHDNECFKFDASRRNPYLSEAWQLQRSSSSISNWVAKNSSDDMKAQLKSWARTVASNIR